MCLYIVQVFRSYTSKVFEFGASYFPYRHRKWNHPFYTFLYLAPFITWKTRHRLFCLNEGLMFINSLDLVYKCQYLKLSVSTQMRRSDTKQKLQALHMYIPSSQYPAHRDLRATTQMFDKTITRTFFFLQVKQHLKEEISLTSAICTNICCGYCGSNTS